MTRRLIALFTGLWLYGFSMAVMIRAAVGLGPWNVFHQGVTRIVPMSFGTVTILTGAVVMLAWIPLRQRPGFGTLSNILLVGVSVDVSLWLLPEWQSLPVRLGAMVLAVALNALAGVLYIGAGLGPGPRDGLMTGLVERTGLSVRLIRTTIEVAVLATGWLLGGSVGLGTVVYAVAIGPLMQLMIPFVSQWLPGFDAMTKRVEGPAADPRAAGPAPADVGCGGGPARPGP
ncbi:YitT family protein [Nocardia sp. NPDC051750]|uniref:membrane protein YczE n=1 Tax=Nocardia sp. NPDC051750 TaxID=3364325 RepID=UPI0037A47269